MSSSAAVLPLMEQFNPPDLFDGHWATGFRESDLYFDPSHQQAPAQVPTAPFQQHQQEQQQQFCCSAVTLPLEFSPASMPSSTLDAEELFGCAAEHSNECSCSDLLTSSLDLTIYDQVDHTDWSKFEYSANQHQQHQQQQQQQSFVYDIVLDHHTQAIMIDEPIHDAAEESYYSACANWMSSDDLGSNRVLSILEPGLDFEGLIDLDHL